MYVCTFCRKERDYVAKGPGVCICEVCLAAIGTRAEVISDDTTCSFCREKERRSRWRRRDRYIVAVGDFGDVRVCSICAPAARHAVTHTRMLDARDAAKQRTENQSCE